MVDPKVLGNYLLENLGVVLSERCQELTHEETRYNHHMMKNTLIVNRETVVARYLETMMEHLRVIQEELHPVEFAGSLAELARELQELSSNDMEVAWKAFREIFRVGSTMMLLSSEDFERLEQLEEDSQEWCVAVFTEDGRPVGLFDKETVTW